MLTIIWHKAFQNILWMLGGQFATKLSGVLTAVVVARTLGPEGLGALSILRDIGAIAVPLITLGISQPITRYVSLFKAKYSASNELPRLLVTIFYFYLAVGLVGPFFIYAASPVIAGMYDNASITGLMPVLAIVVLISIPYELINAIASGLEQFKALALRQLLLAILSPIIVISCVVTWGVGGALIATGLLNFVLALFLLYHLHSRSFRLFSLLSHRPSLAILKSLLAMSMPLLGSIIIMRPLNLIGSTTLVTYASFQELGYFRVAYILYGLMMIIPGAMQLVLLPIFSKGESDHGTAGQGVALVRLTLIFSGPMVALAIPVVEPAIYYVFGVQYAGAAQVGLIMLVVGFFGMIVSILETNIIGQGKTSHQFMVNIVSATLFIVATQLMVPRYQEIGLAGSYLVTEIAALGLYLCLFVLTTNNRLRNLWRPTATSTAVVIVSLCAYALWGGDKLCMLFSSVVILFVSVICVYQLLSEPERQGLKRYARIGR